jgi:hypothetical protein
MCRAYGYKNNIKLNENMCIKLGYENHRIPISKSFQYILLEPI